MKIAAVPGRPLSGAVSLPGDKSISHRAALFAALAGGESQIDNFLVAGVTKVMLEALSELGINWSLRGTRLEVKGIGMQGNKLVDPVMLNCGNSGTTMRLLAGAIATLGISAVLDGSPGLRSRPMKRIVDPLRAMGVSIEASPQNGAPLRIGARSPGRKLKPLDYDLPIASAQVKTCLLLAALGANGQTVLREPGPSRDHTERMLQAMKVDLTRSSGETDPEHFEVRLSPPESRELEPLLIDIPGDFSSAAFLIVAALITPGSRIRIQGVGLNPTRTGLLDALQSMGAGIMISNRRDSQGEPVGDLEIKYQPLLGTQISGSLLVRMIDEIPVFAVAAAHARGRSIVSQAGELRHKESDRISDLCQELRRLGVKVEEKSDGFIIEGGRHVHGGIIDPHGDHRLGMALVVAGLAAQETVIVQNSEIIDESFPEFREVLVSLGGEVHIG
ncbi:MAG: 3-phosphoshikimate 1-carboxyvinyltransferase [Chloroflexota bacterium]|nr:MAG: 3-phosphoshikimate 1-carboxyvinyltransferase [Chloroflexota bacterium]